MGIVAAPSTLRALHYALGAELRTIGSVFQHSWSPLIYAYITLILLGNDGKAPWLHNPSLSLAQALLLFGSAERLRRAG